MLEILDPPGSQIGLHYAQTATLRVQYREDTVQETAVHGQVRFAIFDDPGGSTLSSDRVSASEDGVASVTLTAGAAERSFRIRVSANNASDVEFAISISQLDFVELDVHLGDPVGAGNYTLAALLYEGKHCAELQSVLGLPQPGRRVQRPHAKEAILTFYNLLSRDYAVVGLVEDERSHKRASACAELGAILLPPGSRSSFSLPLRVVPLTVTGAYALSSVLSTAEESKAVVTEWGSLACDSGAAARLLDFVSPHLTATLTSEVEDLRGAVDVDGCRAAELRPGTSSLDADLQALLEVPLGAANALPSIVADVSAFVKAAKLDSRLVVSDGGGGLLLADHTLEQVTLSDASAAKVTYPLAPLGLPILRNRGVGAALQGARLNLEAQAFTLGLPLLWKAALEERAIRGRFPSVSAPILPNFVATIFSAASYGGKSGCEAIEVRLCESVASRDCIGSVAPACNAAVADLAAALGDGFERPTDIDLQWTGHATLVDSNDDLSVDALQDGTWDSLSATFIGTKTP